MDSQRFPDWSKVGRRIGKKLRDILNPPKANGPSQEERQAQRRKDLLKGFVYFDTWEEVFSWAPTEVDQTQIANVPLCPRYTSCIHDSHGSKTRLFLCHDYDGGYHDYESNRPSLLKSKMYSCEHLQYVDGFIYFSHKLVCIPPASWCNLLRRNGVKVFGTFVLEPQTPEPDRMFEIEEGISRLAKILAMMAETYSFDGWLINIEREFPRSTTAAAGQLQRFLEDLKHRLGPKKAIWYDAITIDNEVEYQNGLTEANVIFAKSAGATFTNYRWGLQDLHKSERCAVTHDIQTTDVLFGIDVWAQNTNMPGSPRKTFPPIGGGGTNTGYATGVLADARFSTAIFGAAWSFQHFPAKKGVASAERELGLSIAEAVDNAVWLGDDLPGDLQCDCKQGMPHHTELYKINPISAYAQEFPAGTSSFFFTDFTQAFLEDSDEFKSRLGSQAIMPCPHSSSKILHWEHSRKGIRIIAKTSSRTTRTSSAPFLPRTSSSQTHLCLYRISMPLERAISGELRCERMLANSDVKLSLYLGFTISGSPRVHYEYFTIPAGESSPMSFSQPGKHDGFQLVEVGISCSSEARFEPPSQLLDIYSVLITKHAPNIDTFQLTDIHLTRREIPPEIENRLAWSWTGERAGWPEQLPWSRTTGPFSHFDIYIDDIEIGRAQSCEFPLRDRELSRDKLCAVRIAGTTFAGGTVAAKIELERGLAGPADELGTDPESEWTVIQAALDPNTHI